MELNNIVIISSDEKISRELISRMSLLRASDSVGLHCYDIQTPYLNDNPPDLIIIVYSHSKHPEIISIINQIKFADGLKYTPVILALENDYNNDDIICEAFDNGISDYFNLLESNTKFSLKVIKCLKELQVLKELEFKNELLKNNKIIEDETEFYTKEFVDKIFKNEFEKIINSNTNAVFMVISSQIKNKKTLTNLLLAKKIKESLRKSDVIGFANNNKFYLILYKTTKNDLSAIYEKISKNLGQNYRISCVAANIRQDFETTEAIANENLSKALINNTSLYFIEDKKENKTVEWLENPDLKETDFLIYKQSFVQKYTKIVTPVFFQMQTILQNKFFETEIEQYVNEVESLFLLKKDFAKSFIKIKYPGYARITVEITHNSPFYKAEEKITFDLEDLTQNKIEEILRQLEIDFRKMVDNEQK